MATAGATGATIRRSDSAGSNDSNNCDLLCPITKDVMRYPVKCSDGFVYEKAAILEWFRTGRKTSPMTNLPLSDLTLIPQIDLKKRIENEAIHKWLTSRRQTRPMTNLPVSDLTLIPQINLKKRMNEINKYRVKTCNVLPFGI